MGCRRESRAGCCVLIAASMFVASSTIEQEAHFSKLTCGKTVHLMSASALDFARGGSGGARLRRNPQSHNLTAFGGGGANDSQMLAAPVAVAEEGAGMP